MPAPTARDWRTIIAVVERWCSYAKSRGWCSLWTNTEMQSAGQLVLARAWHLYDRRRSGAYTFGSMVLRQRIGRVYEQEHRGHHSHIADEPIAPERDDSPAASDCSLAERIGRMAAAAADCRRRDQVEAAEPEPAAAPAPARANPTRNERRRISRRRRQRESRKR